MNGNHSSDSYEIYLADRAALQKAEHEQSRLYDRAILTLSAGALGLSIAFIDKIANGKPSHTSLLFTAWAFFAASMLSTLISFISAQEAFRKAIEILDSELSSAGTSLEDSSQASTNRASSLTYFLNISSACLFVVGVCLIVLFAANNFN